MPCLMVTRLCTTDVKIMWQNAKTWGELTTDHRFGWHYQICPPRKPSAYTSGAIANFVLFSVSFFAVAYYCPYLVFVINCRVIKCYQTTMYRHTQSVVWKAIEHCQLVCYLVLLTVMFLDGSRCAGRHKPSSDAEAEQLGCCMSLMLYVIWALNNRLSNSIHHHRAKTNNIRWYIYSVQ